MRARTSAAFSGTHADSGSVQKELMQPKQQKYTFWKERERKG